MRKEQLQERLAVYHDRAETIRKTADEAGRDFTTEEQADLDANLDAIQRTIDDLDRIDRLEKQTSLIYAGTGRKTRPEQPTQTDPETGNLSRGNGNGNGNGKGQGHGDVLPAQVARHSGNWNFRSLGDFGRDVRDACLNRGAEWPRRLQLSQQLAATTYGSEGVGAEGGFAVPPDFRSEIMQTVMAEDSLAGMCTQMSTSGNGITFPVDDTAPWGSSGVQAAWTGEGDTKTQTRPALSERTVKLNKLTALVPLTDELIEDAPALDTYLRRLVPERITFKLNLAIIQGTGVGQPLGVLRSPALVSVAKESSQVADTLVANNVIKAYSRMYAPNRSSAVFVINQDIEPMLLKLSMPGTDNTGAAVTGWGGFVYLPANGFSGSPFATLYGRPIIPSQAAETLGDQGDFIFFDPKAYVLVTKGGLNPKTETSIHLWFDQDITAFRVVLRVGGMPLWATAVSARDGSATYSPYVTIDERA